MFFLAYGPQPGGPKHKLCPSEEPNEAMADRGPDGRMVPTIAWRTHMQTNRDATLPLHGIFRPRHSQTRSCLSGTTRTRSQLEAAQPEREQTPGSKNLR